MQVCAPEEKGEGLLALADCAAAATTLGRVSWPAFVVYFSYNWTRLEETRSLLEEGWVLLGELSMHVPVLKRRLQHRTYTRACAVG